MAKGNRARSHAHRIYDDDPPRCAGCNWEMALIEPVAARPAREAAAALERKAEETRRAEAYAAVLAKVGLTHAEAAVLVEGAQHGGR